MARGLSTRSRFLIAYLVLGAAVGTGIGVFIVLLRAPRPEPAAAVVELDTAGGDHRSSPRSRSPRTSAAATASRAAIR